MKNITILCLLATMLLASCNNEKKCIGQQMGLDPNAPLNTLTEKEKAAGWMLLFNGTDFTGWHGYNMDGIPSEWLVEDGTMTMLYVDGAESQDVITDKIYKDFALSLQYKMTPKANSGIIFQVKEDTVYTYPYETGPEFQIIDDLGWPDKLETWQMNGGNYAMYDAEGEFNKPIGEWNTILLVVNKNMVTQYVNGVKVVEYEKYTDDWTQRRNSGKWQDYPDYGKFDEGHISLQNHGTQVFFRNIKLKELK
jgi:hypothetical protein